ncbi:MAG: extracellular matrix regulatory protein [Thermosipho sp. (in: thermotogales)]|nr:extracellular matrix regulatory protein [Thermosipho sp. (in: thermotogales)]MDN5324976.1 extracellular matrix regulatory protein [Thermosipho sp. (in: thermotogales)]
MFGLINIGFGNVIAGDRIVAIVNPESAPLKRLKEDAKDEGKLIDATYGRKTRAILISDSNHIILSAIQPETIAQRFMQSFYEIEEQLDKIRRKG